MMNILEVNKIVNILLILVVVYFIFTFVNQQTKLNSYNKDISYYTTQIEELKNHQFTLC